MLRRARQIRMQLHELLDACLFALAFCLAFIVRANEAVIEWLHLSPASPFTDYLWLYVVLIPAGPLLLELYGFYDRSVVAPRRKIVWPLLKACLLTTIGLITLGFMFKTLAAGRPTIILFGVLCFPLVLIKEELLRLVYQSKFTQGLRRRFIVAGTANEIARIRAEITGQTGEDIEIVAAVDLDTDPIQKLIHLAHDHAVNGVIVSAKHTYFDQIEAVIRACEIEGVEAWLVADFFATQISRTSFDDLQGRPIMVFRSAPEASWQGILKQLLDFFGASVMLIVLSPFFLLFAALIRLTSPGPIFFRQLRCGLNGQPFTMYKFRTMVTDAEQRKVELAVFNEMSGPVFKMTNDPRIIPIGKFLRKYSIDEWPQLYNVLRGQMSLVGPRPLPVEEVKRFDDLAHRRRLSVKPGLTCLWQIRGRNKVFEFKEWVRLDLEYIDHWSLWLDIRILLRTVPVVLMGSGAK